MTLPDQNKRNNDHKEEDGSFFKVLVQNSSDCICNIDLDGKFKYMSPGGLEMFGLIEDSSVVGQRHNNFVKPEYKDILENMLAKAKKGEIVHFQYEEDTLSGSRWFESSLSPVRDDTGKIKSLIRVSRDITDEKILQDKLRKSEENQREIADILQETMLKIPDEITNLKVGHTYRSSEAQTAKAGGDFYDLIELENDKLGIVIGDVSGKGLEAATITSSAKSTIKAYLYENDSPSEVLSLTNNALEKNTLPSNYITAFLGILDKSTGSLNYCSAGHPRPLIKKSTGTFFLETTSPALGLFADLDFINSTEKLDLGDCLILYTDGVIESRRGTDDFYGSERLSKFIKTLDDIEIKDIPSAIIENVLEYIDRKLADDIAILTVSRRKDAN